MLHFDRVVKMTSSTYALYKGEKRVAELYITALGAMLVLEDKTVVEYDGENAYDMVILLSRGYYGVSALLYNSTSVAVALAANTSVLILR